MIEVVHAMEDSLEKEGYKLEVVAFDDIKQPNVALDEGSLDGNLYQHKPFLDSFNNDNGTKLKFVEPLFGGLLHYIQKNGILWKKFLKMLK